MSTTLCNVCGEKISVKKKNGDALISAGVHHHASEHSKTPEACYGQFERTWNPVYDRLIRTGKEMEKQAEVSYTNMKKMEEAYKQEAALRNTLATKLNGIIMILEHKS